MAPKLRWMLIGSLLAGALLHSAPLQGAAPDRASRMPQLASAAALVMDQTTGECLLAKRADAVMPIASITKLMTAMVLLDAPIDMEEVLTIEEGDKDTMRHSRSRLPVGTRLTRRQALLLSLMASENRAAHALARTFPGGMETFVSSMNAKARYLGLTETHFEEPTGLSENNVATATELARLVNAAFQYPQIRACSTQTEAVLRSKRKEVAFHNTNALVRNPKWKIGLSKTGFIEEGGRCLVMQTRLAQRPLLIVLLNSTGRFTRLGDAVRIKQWIEGPEPRARKAQPRRPRQSQPRQAGRRLRRA